MPKRVIDGDALWTSTKLEKVSDKYRGEYAWILPLSQVNGCFECTPRLVWRTCYAGIRDDWSAKDVEAMLNEFETAKMLFRFEREGTMYGLFIGIQKDGRLPKPSDRLKSAKLWQGGMVPAPALASFLGVSLERVKEDYGGLLATYSLNGRPQDKAIVYGADDANEADTDKEDEKDMEKVTVKDKGGSSFAATSSERSVNQSLSTPNSSPRGQSTSTSVPATKPPLNAATPLPLATRAAAERFAEQWYDLMFRNEHADRAKQPKNWSDSWEADFLKVLEVYSKEDVADMIVYSQLPDQQKYHVRPEAFKKNMKMIHTNTMRMKKDEKKWEALVAFHKINLCMARSARQDEERKRKDEDEDDND